MANAGEPIWLKLVYGVNFLLVDRNSWNGSRRPLHLWRMIWESVQSGSAIIWAAQFLQSIGKVPTGKLWLSHGKLEVSVPDPSYILTLKLLSGREVEFLSVQGGGLQSEMAFYHDRDNLITM